MGRKPLKQEQHQERSDATQLVRSQSSVEVKRDAKGVVSFAVKVYHDEPDKAAAVAAALADKLSKKYPNPQA